MLEVCDVMQRLYAPVSAFVLVCALFVTGARPQDRQERLDYTGPYFVLPQDWTKVDGPRTQAVRNGTEYVGELQFGLPPEFGKAGSPELSTHAGAWVLNGSVDVEGSFLKENMIRYLRILFEGELAPSITISDPDGFGVEKVHRAEEQAQSRGHEVTRWSLLVSGFEWVDGGKEGRIQLNVDSWYCHQLDRTVLFVRAGSGKPGEEREELLWKAFSGFSCHQVIEPRLEPQDDSEPKAKTKLRFG